VGGRPLNEVLDARKVTWPASYREYRFDGDQSIELLDDRVVIKGKRIFGPEYEINSVLSALDPVPNRFRVRPTGFWQGIFLAAVSLALTRLPYFSTEGSAQVALPWGAAFSLLMLSVATFKKVEWVQYTTRSGTVAFNIAKAGRRGGSFDRFVEHLSRRIAEAQSTAVSEATGDSVAGV
jgi:hypothetical protein